jgi:hypothetical protein
MPTAIGDVVPAVNAVFTAALASQPYVSVYTGPKPNSEYATEYVTVGYDPEGSPGVDTEQVISPMGNRWIEEQGNIQCQVVCWSGEDDTGTLLARADDIFDLLDAALAANPSLTGVLSSGNFARVLGRASMTPVSDQNGVRVTLSFTVNYSTLLT